MAGRSYKTEAIVLRSFRLGEADRVLSHRAAREDSYWLGVGLVGLEAMLRLFSEQEANARAFSALARFLDVLDESPSCAPARPALDPLALAFQLKLLWLSGYLPHLGSCTECGSEGPVVGYSPRSGGAVCRTCATDALTLSPAGITAIDGLLRRPLADAGAVPLDGRSAREALAVITAWYEFHGGFRLRTLSA